MSSLEVAIIIILVLGVIVSNLAALKYSAKFKLPQFGQPDKDKTLKTDAPASPAATSVDPAQHSGKPSTDGDNGQHKK